MHGYKKKAVRKNRVRPYLYEPKGNANSPVTVLTNMAI